MNANPAPSPVEKLVNSNTVCESLSICRATLYKAINAGKFPPPIKIGAASRWPQSAITAFIAARSQHQEGVQ